MRRSVLISLFGLALGCGDSAAASEGAEDETTDTTTSDETGAEAPACEPGEDGLPRVHDFDPELASLGETIMRSELGEGLIPRLALDNMWLAWGEPPYADLDAYWTEFRRRYGLVEAPWDNDGLPIGLHMVDAQLATLDCLFCHSDRIAGQTLVGAGSGAVDFQGFYDDLVTLNELAPMFNIPSLPLPWSISDRTSDLHYEEDGSLTLVLSAERPSDTANWLPVTAGPFMLGLRVYEGLPDVIDCNWFPPALMAS